MSGEVREGRSPRSRGLHVSIYHSIRERAGLLPGTELDVVLDDLSIRLVRSAPRPRLVREGDRWVVRPTADRAALPEIDLASFIEEERNRWPA